MPRPGSRFVPAPGIYLLAHSVGLPTRAATRAAEGFLRRWAEEGGEGWHEWLPAVFEGFTKALGRLFNVPPEGFCPQTNVSSGLSKLLFSLPKEKGRDTIVLSELDFPSAGFALAQGRRAGYRLRLLPARSTLAGPEGWSDALDSRARLALITHGFFGNGTLSPVQPIARLARSRGVLTVADVAQTAGVLPIDLGAWGVDFAVGSCIKWLCGGPGAGFLWIRKGLLPDLKPIDAGWMSHEDPMEFDIRRFRFASSARRFAGGTPSVVPYLCAAASISELVTIGIGRVRRHNLALTSQLLEGCSRIGLPTLTPSSPDRRGGTVVLPLKDADRALARLRRRGIRCDLRRGYGLRFSPHLYNTERDIETLLRALHKEA